MRTRVSIVIDAPPAVVWDAIEDISTHPEWMADAGSIEFMTHRTRGVDTTFVNITRFGPFHTRDVVTVTEWAPRRAMGIVHKGAVTGRGRFTLRRRRGGRTKFTWRERLRLPWYFGGPFGAVIAKPVFHIVWKRNLRRLKANIEGKGVA